VHEELVIAFSLLLHPEHAPLTATRVLSSWSWHPVEWAVLALTAFLYALGLARLWRSAGRGQGVRVRQAASFFGGWLALVVALVSPIDALSSLLVSVHMAQHEILMLIAAPLLVLARPLGVYVWALPPGARAKVGRAALARPVQATWRVLTGGLMVFLLHAAALWVWHVPLLYEAALASDGVHAVQHVSFLFTATLFFWALVHGRYGRLGYGAAVVFLFLTAVHSSVLGALLTFAPRLWYPAYRARTESVGLDPLEHQQLAGLLMWVPFGIVFVIVGLALFAAWLGESERRVRLAERSALTALLLFVLAGTGCGASDSPTVAATGGDPERGKALVQTYGCGSCHQIPGVPGANASVGPPLAQFSNRSYIAGHLPNTPENLAKWIRFPQEIRHPNAMPDMNVTDKDARSLAAFLYTLK
jgi:putative membrane protein